MSMELFYIILLLTGAGVGFATGLLGVGGGFILVPIQFFLLQSLGVDPTIALRISLGTSLAVILPTALSGAYGHYSRKTMIWKPALYMGLSGVICAFLGGSIATHIAGEFLRIIFGVVLLGVVIQMVLSQNPPNDGYKENNNLYLIFWGSVAGLMSGLLGIGGGVILVPVMILLLGFTTLEAIGTSAAIIIFTSIGGIIAYIYNGWNVSGLPPYSLGYVNLVGFIILAGMSIPMAQLGVFTAHRLPEKQLRYIFIFILVYIALKMLGVFDCLGLPL
ncbi:MAG: sulfite exporter TauE/SafE family protein [Methanobacteriaceae archaeon]|nr:sulfite exporter TauE/SafE family protein [Methanobacteriaceae archaeon]